MAATALPQQMSLPTGASRTIAIVGHPTVQVKSPGAFNARFAALGLDVVMFSMDVAPAGIEAFIAMLRAWENAPGCVVTVPHKQALARACDELTPRAAALGAVNVVRREAGGRLVGDMTDGMGFVAAAVGHGLKVKGAKAAVIGCGGAGSAIAWALAEAGAAELRLTDPEAARMAALAEKLRAEFPALKLVEGFQALNNVDLAVNASPVGMNEDARLPFPTESLGGATLVADVVTRPEITPWLAAAKARGCRIQTGAEMTAGQLVQMARHLGLDFSSVP